MEKSGKSIRTFRLLLIVLALPSIACAQVPATSDEVKELRQELQGVKRELAEIRKALAGVRQQLGRYTATESESGPPPGSITKVDSGRSPSLGRTDAPVTIVEFSDYQCPYCRRHTATTLPEIRRRYVDTGKVRYVFRDFPIDALHPQARKASEAARCAEDQGKYWEMHDLLFAKQRLLEVDELKRHATALMLDTVAFDSCLDEGKRAPAVTADARAARAAGVVGTPTFFIGRTTPGGAIDATRLVGAQSIENFSKAIDTLLESKN